jgi:PAS domain S-box-containing protein
MHAEVKPLAPDDAEQILTDTPFLLTRCSSDLRYLFASEAYARMIGRTAQDVVGKKIREVMGEQGFNTILPYITAVLSGQRVEYETRVHFEGIGARLLHVIYTPDKDRSGHIRGWIASIVDITDRREAQDRVAADLQATERLRAIASECIRSDLTVNDCLEKVLDAAIEIAGAKKGNLQLFDKHSNALRIRAQRGFGRAFLDFFDSVEGGDASACAAALKNKSPVVVRDVSSSEIFVGHSSYAVLTGEDVHAVISVPLVSSKGSVLGMLSTHFPAPHEPQAQELHFLELLAGIAADFVQRRRAEETEQLLLHEVQHRSNNLLAVVQALASQSLAGKDFEGFQKRLYSLARTNQRIIDSHGGRMSVLDSVSDQLGPFANRVTVHGPVVIVSPKQAQDIGLMIHELVTNAAKYGALSNEGGAVHIQWEEGPASHLRLAWKEQGGPKVEKPVRVGFGTRLLAATLPGAKIDYAPDGLSWQVELKLN